MDTYVEQGFSFVWIVLVYLVLPLVKCFLFDQLQIVHLMKQVSKEVFGKAFGLSVDLHGVDCLDLLLKIRV